MKQWKKRILALVTCLVMVFSVFPKSSAVYAAENGEYTIYPTPHEMTYEAGDYILRQNVNVIYDDGIDAYTKARLEETMDLKGLKVSESDAAVKGATNVYVGINGSGGPAETYIEANYTVDASLFGKIDSYFLASDNNTIVVLGRDTDASFYGLTTLYHVLAQMESLTIRNFTVKDHADVVSRGFIEGYYGNPWSTEDRCNLMEWGGYYKLNSYFYAPKDDPKHNAQWKSLYTAEEIETKIKPLAEAGNASKCRFVYALHPYMNSPIRYTSTAAYQEDLAAMQAKFEQVIKAGVRQIAILADDANNVGSSNYIKTLNDMTNWIKEKQKTYPDLKLTLPFCTQEYMYFGESYYSSFPQNVQIVMTGGKVWGEVSNSFTQTFTNKVGRGPYLWINWPCTDNSKKHLIMGGYTTFLQPGVDPSNIQGIVLNPMQQSEPSKVAIFGNACYSWNIWESADEADAAWDASFSFVDHNTAVPNAASNALKELSKHMINQNMDTRVTALQESVELKDKLNDFKNKLSSETVTAEDVDALIDEFEILQNAAKTYRTSAGDTAIRNQIVYWLNCWDDTTEAAIAYLNAVKAAVAGDLSSVLDYNVVAKTAFDRSKTYGFHYVDHTEYAEVGVQHIVPFISTLATYVSTKAELAINPDQIITTYITNRTDLPAVGSVENILDGDVSSNAIYQNPNKIVTGDYIGVKYSKVIDINNIRFVLGAGKDHFDQGKLQYTMDGNTWEDITLTGMTNSFTGTRNVVQDISVASENLPEDFKAMGIRFIATIDNEADAWLEVREIIINDAENAEFTTTVTLDRISLRAGTLESINDESATTYAHLAEDPYKGGTIQDYIPVDGTVTLNFSKAIQLGAISFKQDSGTDKISKYAIEYTADGNTWKTLREYDGNAEVNLNVSSQNITATAVRVRNLELNLGSDTTGYWWKLYKFTATPYGEDSGSDEDLELSMTPFDSGQSKYSGSLSNVVDGNTGTSVWYGVSGAAGQYIGVDLGASVKLGEISFVMDAGDCWSNYELQYSTDGSSYKTYGTYTTPTIDVDLTTDEIEARYVRFYNKTGTSVWTKIYEIDVQAQKERRDLIYSNLLESSAFTVAVGEGAVTLNGSATITLAPGEYIGLDLKNIKGINSIQTADSQAQLQTSMNTIIWTDVTGNNYEDARYIRLVNEGTSKITVDFSGLTVSYDEIFEKSVTSTLSIGDTSRDMRSLGNVENVFDGNLSTYGEITGSQTANGQIVFDLGQEVDFESFRYYIVETNRDYLRYAAFEVANDPKATQWNRILVVGESGFANTADESTAKDASYLTHDSSNPGYMYAEATDLNVSGRYLRVVPLETYAHRWVQFNELQINGGTYLSSESNRDILADAVEEDYKIPSNALDGNYTTTYKSSAPDSTFTYRVSVADQRTIRIIQNGAVSGAALTAKVYKNGAVSEITLGNLDQTINEFALPEDMQLLEVTAKWEDAIPEISIIQTSSKAADANVNKAALLEEMNLKDDEAIATWTKASQDAYTTAFEAATVVYDNEYATQSAVDMAKGALESARVNAVVKGDIAALQKALDEKKANEVDGVEIYSARTYTAYADVIAKMEAAVADADNTSDADTAKLLEELAAAEAALEYSLIQRELAEVTLENDVDAFKEEECDPETYKAYTDAKAALEAAVAADKETRMNPIEIASLLNAYNAAKEGVLDKDGEVVVTPTVTPEPTATPEPTTTPEPTATPEPTGTPEPTATPSVENPFDDVEEKEFYYAPVLWAVENNITNGVEPKLFKPEDPCTRGQIITFIWRAEGQTAPTSTECKFQDVDADQFYYNPMLWGVEKGIINGLTETTFGPDDTCTRGQLVTMLWRAMDKPEAANKEHAFEDVDAAQFYYEPMLWAVEKGITKGQTATKFAPDAPVKRGETVTFLYRAYGNIE